MKYVTNDICITRYYKQKEAKTKQKLNKTTHNNVTIERNMKEKCKERHDTRKPRRRESMRFTWLQTKLDKTRQEKTTQGKTTQDKTRQDKKRQHNTRQDKTRQDKTRQDKKRHN